ncbi:MAG: molecular chaperone DnaK, partial [Erythrobacter sp.]
EEAIAATKTALEGDDAEEIGAKAQELTQAAMKMGEQIYKQEQENQASESTGDETSAAEEADEDVVDAEFSEVDDEKKDKE